MIVPLSDGALRVRDEGSGPTLVFLHGVLVNGSSWDGAVERLRSDHRCIVVEMPLGSHTLPLPAEADRTPHGQALRVAELLEKLDLHDVTLVGNDAGGAIGQILVATNPSRIGRLVLTNCDAFEVFPAPAFAWLKTLARHPRWMGAMCHLLARFPVLARSPTAFGRVTRRRIPGHQLRAWTAPGVDPAIRADVAGFLAGVDPEVLPRLEPALRRFDKPVLLAWGTGDPFFPLSLGDRLRAVFPQASLVPIHDCATFVAIDAPEVLATAIASFVDDRTQVHAASA